jgi:hypothetical protein
VRSLIEADEASRLNGMDALHQSQRAVATVLEALALATNVRRFPPLHAVNAAIPH